MPVWLNPHMSPVTECLCCPLSSKWMSASTFFCVCAFVRVCVHVCVVGSTRWLLGASLSLWERGAGLAKLSVMSVAFNTEGKTSAVSPTEPDPDCCVFVLDVSTAALDAEQTPDLGQHSARGRGGRTWGMLGNEIWWDQGLDYGNLPRFMDVKVRG